MESIPEGLVYEDNSTASPSTFEAWAKLLADARSSVDIAAFYWTLQNKDTRTQDPSAWQVRGQDTSKKGQDPWGWGRWWEPFCSSPSLQGQIWGRRGRVGGVGEGARPVL